MKMDSISRKMMQYMILNSAYLKIENIFLSTAFFMRLYCL